AAALWRSIAREPACGAHWRSLARAYAAQELPWQAAYAARQALRVEPGSSGELQAPGLDADRDAATGEGPLGSAVFDHAPRLIARFRACVADCPGDWRTWLYLARLEELASASLRSDARARAVDCEPWPGETLHWIGHWRLEAGDTDGAVEALS